MVKAQKILVHYAQVIDQMVGVTQKQTAALNGDYELVKEALASDTVAAISQDQWTAIARNFAAGVKQYQESLATVQAVRPPAKAVGIHQLLVKAYGDYVAGCAQMAASVDPKVHQVDAAAFKAAEKQQDASSLALNKQLARLAPVLR